MKRVLIVSPFVPYPPDRGHRVRMYWLMRQLSEGYRVGLTTQCFDRAEEESVGMLRRVFPELDPVEWVRSPAHRSVVHRVAYSAGSRVAAAAGILPRERIYHSSRPLAAAVRRIVASWRPHLVQGEYWFSRWAVPSASVSVWIDTIDLHWLRLMRASDHARSPWRRAVLRRQGRLVMRHELKAYATADRILAVHRIEAETLERRMPHLTVSVVPISCEVPPQPVPRDHGHTVLFVGAMDYAPNQDAVRFLAECVMPEVRSLVPDARLRVVGRVAGARGLVHREWTHYAGHVADLRSEIPGVGAAVAPLRLGSGTSVKVPTILGLGLPLVASSRAVEGLPVRPTEHYLPADSAAETVRAVAALLHDEAQARALGRRGHEAALHAFDWRRTAAGVLATYVEGLGG